MSYARILRDVVYSVLGSKELKGSPNEVIRGLVANEMFIVTPDCSQPSSLPNDVKNGLIRIQFEAKEGAAEKFIVLDQAAMAQPDSKLTTEEMFAEQLKEKAQAAGRKEVQQLQEQLACVTQQTACLAKMAIVKSWQGALDRAFGDKHQFQPITPAHYGATIHFPRDEKASPLLIITASTFVIKSSLNDQHLAEIDGCVEIEATMEKVTGKHQRFYQKARVREELLNPETKLLNNSVLSFLRVSSRKWNIEQDKKFKAPSYIVKATDVKMNNILLEDILKTDFACNLMDEKYKEHIRCVKPGSLLKAIGWAALGCVLSVTILGYFALVKPYQIFAKMKNEYQCCAEYRKYLKAQKVAGQVILLQDGLNLKPKERPVPSAAAHFKKDGGAIVYPVRGEDREPAYEARPKEEKSEEALELRPVAPVIDDSEDYYYDYTNLYKWKL